MKDLPDSVGVDTPGVLPSKSPVRCGLCGLPVVRSLTAPPVLMHQVVAAHGGVEGGAVDFFLMDGPCPLEGAPIPEEALGILPPATLPWIEATSTPSP
jgi:hypothetical protein